jgi:hypothetical protein
MMMTVAELRELLASYKDEMELYIIAEEMIGNRCQLFAIHDYSTSEGKVILSGQLSKKSLPRLTDQKLTLN